jgi:DNA invertase Pin-like site-specific DNA recombinase
MTAKRKTRALRKPKRTKTELRAGIYARVSTQDQQTLPNQLKAMREYVRARSYQLAIELTEVGSGAKIRPQREALMQAARRRDIDLIVVWKLDRWGRSVPDLVVTLNELRELGVGFVSLTEALDFTTPSGRAMAGLLSVFAEFERDILRERVKSGIEEARARGGKHGRPATARLHAREVRKLHAKGKGLSKAAIARRLNIGRSSVQRMLADQKSIPLVNS